MIFKCTESVKKGQTQENSRTTKMKQHESVECKSRIPLTKFKTENLTETK